MVIEGGPGRSSARSVKRARERSRLALADADRDLRAQRAVGEEEIDDGPHLSAIDRRLDRAAFGERDAQRSAAREVIGDRRGRRTR
jgi:hypothetical protein